MLDHGILAELRRDCHRLIRHRCLVCRHDRLRGCDSVNVGKRDLIRSRIACCIGRHEVIGLVRADHKLPIILRPLVLVGGIIHLAAVVYQCRKHGLPSRCLRIADQRDNRLHLVDVVDLVAGDL